MLKLSPYLDRPLRRLRDACRESAAARGEEPPCDACSVSDRCATDPAPEAPAAPEPAPR